MIGSDDPGRAIRIGREVLETIRKWKAMSDPPKAGAHKKPKSDSTPPTPPTGPSTG
jgi:hypothetical protein